MAIGRPRNTPAKFWARVTRIDGSCWLWRGEVFRDGYGSVRWTDSKRWRAHRVAWTLAYGAIPPGLCVCHRCDVPLCCNPSHLFLGTVADNTRDRDIKYRTARGERSCNAKLTDEQVREMRALYNYCTSATRGRRKLGEMSFIEVGRIYGVSGQVAARVLRRQGWKHVA